MNKNKIKGDTFERSIIHLAEEKGLKAYRNRMSRAVPGESWDLNIAGHRIECKKCKAGFKKLYEWMRGNEGALVGADYEKPLVVLRLEDWLKLL